MAFEGDLFRSVVQGGSFAVLVLILMWAIFRYEPRSREMMEKKDVLHSEIMKETVKSFGDATQKIVAECAAVMQKQMEQNRLMLEAVLNKYNEQATTDRKECRDERKEWMDAITKEMETNRETMAKEMDANRKSRHDLANQMHRMLGEVLEEGIKEGADRRSRDDKSDDDKRRRDQM